MTIATKNWWEESSEDYQEASKIPTTYIHYGVSCPPESKLRLLGKIKGKRILEIGCGGAQNSIYFAKHGAKVNAVDISAKQLKFAKKLAEKNKVLNKIIFNQGDIKNLKPIKSKSQNIVFSVFALQYVDDLKKCFREVNRVLKKNGLFVFSLDHPFFDTFMSKKWGKERSYFKTGKFSVDWGRKSRFVMYDHTVSELFNLLIESGFVVEKILEPQDNKKYYKYDPWHRLWDYTKKNVEKYPPTIIFKARKK